MSEENQENYLADPQTTHTDVGSNQPHSEPDPLDVSTPKSSPKSGLKTKILAKLDPVLQHLKKRPKIVLILGVLFSLLFTALGTALLLPHEESAPPTEKHGEAPVEVHPDKTEHGDEPSKPESEIQSTDPRLASALLDLLLERRLYLKAAELESALSKDAMHSPELAYKLGRALIGAGQSPKALPYLEKALQMDGQNPELKALLLLGRIRSGSTDPHLHDLQDLAKTYSENSTILTHLADAYLSLGQNKEALEALSHWKLTPELQTLRARASMNLEGCKGAMALAESITSSHPEQQGAWAILAYCHHKAGNAAGALKAYGWATGLNDEDYNSWYNLGELHYALANASEQSQIIQNENRAALEAMLKSVRYNPSHPEAHFRIGTLMLYNKQYREAIQHFSLSKDNPEMRVRSFLNISSAWQSLGDRESAEAYMDSAKATAPESPEVHGQAEALENKPKPKAAPTHENQTSSGHSAPAVHAEKPTEFQHEKTSTSEHGSSAATHPTPAAEHHESTSHH